MNSIYWVLIIGLLMNIPSLTPMLFLRKTQKNVKVWMAVRLFLLNAFLSWRGFQLARRLVRSLRLLVLLN